MAEFSFYSNENFALDMVEMFRQFYKVTTSYEAGQANQAIPDDAVLNYATNNRKKVFVSKFLLLKNILGKAIAKKHNILQYFRLYG